MSKLIALIKERNTTIGKPRLTIELVPKTCWCSNVRDNVTKTTWDKLRKATYAAANYCCEVCGEQGVRHPVECHEIWRYHSKQLIQKLFNLIALCPACHEVKHFGLAEVRGRGNQAFRHLITVNQWSASKGKTYLRLVEAIWRERSRHQWALDLSWLERAHGVKVKPQREQLALPL